ncbi:Smr/MutS family protein [Pontibacterium granulatum]|uniref:Smr/MutS family protein n=1 Tax=Pontibacterium granulatum TaxID=2036029 RepID=UPI00249A966D|nr:Smr/MutS family protein [Pontibacterium granulatum]MDI3324986.1 Smr/MutS family protein [Pontibacterium granulatum]
MSDRTKPDNNDEDFSFADAMQGVTRHCHDKADLKPARHKDINLDAKRAAATVEEEKVIDNLSSEAVDLVESSEELLFASPGVQLRVLRRLKQGHIPWEEGLDLHGYTVDNARDELSRFIRTARARNMRCVIVVHGKAYSQAGKQPLLKSYVNEWLRRMPGVLAFTSAQDRDGGTGALYVLLKKGNNR